MSGKMEMPHTGYVSAKQVREYFSISNSTLYNWVDGGNQGFPKPVKIGPRAIRFAAESIRSFEKARAEEGLGGIDHLKPDGEEG